MHSSAAARAVIYMARALTQVLRAKDADVYEDALVRVGEVSPDLADIERCVLGPSTPRDLPSEADPFQARPSSAAATAKIQHEDGCATSQDSDVIPEFDPPATGGTLRRDDASDSRT